MFHFPTLSPTKFPRPWKMIPLFRTFNWSDILRENIRREREPQLWKTIDANLENRIGVTSRRRRWRR